ncbi:MAG: heparan-alpha-glucosaminide N-acetyltransferase domain-containing protein [Elusimicrobia bacterium]|nr:heparan-alpha-glucosaminide N-acetyltransferase domain-containing protein [Elusimicrobiota bacterium]
MSEAPSGRLASLDIFRGLTVAGMIVVNSPGNNQAYPALEHAAWNGCTPTDLVFPFFLFIAGTAVAFSLSKRKRVGEPRAALALQVLKRAAVIYAFGLLLNAIPNYHLSTIRLLGVLPRIALCILGASVLFLTTRARTQAAAVLGLLGAYWLAMTWIPAPGYGAGMLTPEASLASWLDRLVLGRHTYHQGPFDPEGILSTLPALATTLLGLLAGQWLLAPRPRRDQARGLLLAGAPMIAAGLIWGRFFPINKSLWTSSYVLYTGGLAACALSLCYWAADIAGWKAWGRPFEALGRNALTAYVVPILMLKFLVLTKVAGAGGETPQLRVWLCDRLFGFWLSPLNASLAFALAYLGLWTAVFWALYRKNIFWKA